MGRSIPIHLGIAKTTRPYRRNHQYTHKTATHTRHVVDGYDEFGGMLLERLRVCVERGMSADEIVPQLLDVGEIYTAFTHGEVMARRARFVNVAIFLCCEDITTGIRTPGLSANAQDEYDRHLLKMTDKVTMKCKGLSVESARKRIASDVPDLMVKYMETTTGVSIDESAITIQMMDYALRMCVTLLDIENEGIDLEQIFSYGDDGNTLRTVLTEYDLNYGSDGNDKKYTAWSHCKDV